MSAMTTPATPLDRAKRVQELSAKATEGPWMQPDDEAMVLPDDDEIDTPKIAECCQDPTEPATPEEIANAVFIAETRTLAPALAEDVLKLTSQLLFAENRLRTLTTERDQARAEVNMMATEAADDDRRRAMAQHREKQLTALWDLCKPLCQHVPEVAEMARALGLLPAAQPKSEPTIQERLAEAREELARRHAYRQRMINQDAFDGADEAWTSQLEHVRELEAEAAEAGLLPARKEESDG